MKLHVQVAGTAMLISPHEPEWRAIVGLPGFAGPDRQYLLGRTHEGTVHLCVADGWMWVEASPEPVTDEGLLWLVECAEARK